MTERLRSGEERAARELEAVRAQGEERVGELIIEKSDIKDKLAAIEKQMFALKREAADAEAKNKNMSGELEAGQN
jgi:hypothetical protein